MDGSRRSILLVDDDQNLAAVLRVFLEMDGFEVSVVANGAIALRMLAKTRFDLVISDVRMPGVDGFALLERLREPGLHAPRPVILISADALPSDNLANGFDAYLHKPFSTVELREAIDRALSRSAVVE